VSPERAVKTTLVIDSLGAVRALRSTADESGRTEHHLGKLDKSVKGLGRSFGGLKSMIGFGLSGLGVGGLAFGLSSIASKTKEVTSETEKFHAITGIGAQSSLYYTQALKARGLSGESVTKAFGFLAKNMRSAELQEHKFAMGQEKATAKGKITTSELGRQATAFKELGISLAGFNHLTEQQKLEKITKSFEALAPGIRKTRLERELFGRGGNQLSTVLEKNNLGLSHQIALAKKFFPTIKGGAGAMNELLEKQAESKMAWEGFEFTIGQKLIPAMNKVMTVFSEVVVWLERQKGLWRAVGNAAQIVGGILRGVVGAVKTVVAWFERHRLATDALKVSLYVMSFGLLYVVTHLETMKKVVRSVVGVFEGMGQIVKGVFTGIANIVISGINLIIKAINVMISGYNSVQKSIPFGLGTATIKPIGEIEALGGAARGGAARPTHGRAPVPAPRRGGFGGEGGVGFVGGLVSPPQQTVHHHHSFTIKGEGPLTQALAHALRHEPHARRELAEGVAQYAQGMAARK